MLLFVLGDFFSRRRPRRADDPLPLQPLVQVMAFWTLLTTGAFFAGTVLAALAGVLFIDLPLGPVDVFALTALAMGSPFCLWAAMRFWWRLTR